MIKSREETRLAVLYLDRPGALGNVRRLATWRLLAEVSSASFLAVPLPVTNLAPPTVQRVRSITRGRAVPEILAWDPRPVIRKLRAYAPSVVVCITARCFDANAVPAGVPIVLDYVDMLSENYRLRASLASLPRSLVYRALAFPSKRFEKATRSKVAAVASSYSEARALGACWLPNLVPASMVNDAPAKEESSRSYDFLFVGNLRYEPNVDALVTTLAPIWPHVRRLNPSASLLIAGASPSRALRSFITQQPGWALRANFDALASVIGEARIALAPITRATGIQNKVLEAAAAGLPQIVSTAAARGLDPDFPFVVASTQDEWIATMTTMLRDKALRDDVGWRAREHVREHYGAIAFVSLVDALISH